MSYDAKERSTDSASPIELYLFTYNGMNYQYTSSQRIQEITYNDTNYSFSPAYIQRGDSLKLGDSSGSVETCTVTVGRDNSVALLYQGPPPEKGKIRLQVFRKHGEASDEFIRIINGTVSQVRMTDSEAELTITIENLLNREIPRGKLSYFCQNCTYDEKCGLNVEDWKIQCFVNIGMRGLDIYSSQLGVYEDGFFTNGGLIMGDSIRAIAFHEGNHVRVKYPINESDKGNVFYVYPGCDGLFSVCYHRFGNTDHFSGIPYKQPYNAFTHPVDTGVYWVDSAVIARDTDCRIYQIGL